jgi:hypothetical protein
MSPSTNPELLNLTRERFECSPESLLHIDTKMKSIAFADEEDVDQSMDSPLSEIDDEEIVALGIAAGHILEDDRKRIDVMKICNSSTPEPTSNTSEKVYRLSIPVYLDLNVRN